MGLVQRNYSLLPACSPFVRLSRYLACLSAGPGNARTQPIEDFCGCELKGSGRRRGLGSPQALESYSPGFHDSIVFRPLATFRSGLASVGGLHGLAPVPDAHQQMVSRMIGFLIR
jgi:hypothetical protein